MASLIDILAIFVIPGENFLFVKKTAKKTKSNMYYDLLTTTTFTFAKILRIDSKTNLAI